MVDRKSYYTQIKMSIFWTAQNIILFPIKKKSRASSTQDFLFIVYILPTIVPSQLLQILFLHHPSSCTCLSELLLANLQLLSH